ncbi:MAG: serine hydrolase domain-containing protein [Panacagrimonas sp.]
MRNKSSWLTPGPAVGVALLVCACGGGGGGSSSRDYDWTAVDAVLDARALPKYAFQITVDDEVVYERRTAGSGLEPIFPIASASKALASAALLTLVRDGKLDLDLPVSTYIGDVVEWPRAKEDITTRMLLNHTSGLQTENDCLLDINGDLTECVQAIADSRLEAIPGAKFSYGGASYQVAGLIAEVISEQPFNEFFQSAIAAPLGMDATLFDGTNPRIAGGARSTASDYLRFMQMVLHEGEVDGTVVLAPEQARALRTSQIGDLTRAELPPGADEDTFEGYTFGWWTSTTDVLLGLSDGPEISDPGVFGTVPWLDFDRRYAAILLSEEGVETGTEIWNELRPLILSQLSGKPIPSPDP